MPLGRVTPNKSKVKPISAAASGASDASSPATAAASSKSPKAPLSSANKRQALGTQGGATGAKSKPKKKKKSKSKKSESLNDDDNKKPTEPVRKLTKPEGQVELTEEERKEEIQQVLTGDDPNLPRNVCKYSYKDRCFKLDPPGQSDHMAVHYADEGSSLHVESKEYHLQKELEDQKAEARKKKQMGDGKDDGVADGQGATSSTNDDPNGDGNDTATATATTTFIEDGTVSYTHLRAHET